MDRGRGKRVRSIDVETLLSDVRMWIVPYDGKMTIVSSEMQRSPSIIVCSVDIHIARFH